MEIAQRRGVGRARGLKALGITKQHVVHVLLGGELTLDRPQARSVWQHVLAVELARVGVGRSGVRRAAHAGDSVRDGLRRRGERHQALVAVGGMEDLQPWHGVLEGASDRERHRERRLQHGGPLAEDVLVGLDVAQGEEAARAVRSIELAHLQSRRHGVLARRRRGRGRRLGAREQHEGRRGGGRVARLVELGVAQQALVEARQVAGVDAHAADAPQSEAANDGRRESVPQHDGDGSQITCARESERES